MSDTPIFDEAAKDRPFPSQPPVGRLTEKQKKRRAKRGKALTNRVWKEICDKWNVTPW